MFFEDPYLKVFEKQLVKKGEVAMDFELDEALQIFGGYGYMAEQPIEHYYRDAWAIGALLGTEEELNDIIAESILGPVSLK